MKHLFLSAALLGAVVLAPTNTFAQSETYPEAKAIVSIGGPVTEIIFALGEGDRVIARDTTSRYPAEVNALPDVGYMRRLSSEGVLSVAPDLILSRDTAGPVEAIDQLKAAAIPFIPVKDGFSETSVIAAVHTVGDAIGASDKADALAADIEARFRALHETLDGLTDAPRVVFILSNQAGRLNVAGAGTGADGIIALTGAQNVMAAEYSGYKIAGDEAIIAAAPDVVVMMSPTGQSDHDNNREEVLDLPALSQTPAGQNRAFVEVNPAALGFGPRTAEFALTLHNDIWAAAGKPTASN